MADNHAYVPAPGTIVPVINHLRDSFPASVDADTLKKLGFEVKVIGRSRQAARYAGISYFWTIFRVMLISGGAAGLAGAGEVAGVHHMLRHPDQVSLGTVRIAFNRIYQIGQLLYFLFVEQAQDSLTD